jgi:hypothetical protein
MLQHVSTIKHVGMWYLYRLTLAMVVVAVAPGFRCFLKLQPRRNIAPLRVASFPNVILEEGRLQVLTGPASPLNFTEPRKTYYHCYTNQAAITSTADVRPTPITTLLCFQQSVDRCDTRHVLRSKASSSHSS